MIKIIGRSYLVDYWSRHPETEDILKAWFYQSQNTFCQNKEKVIQNFPKTKILNLQLAPSVFLLVKFHEKLKVLRILSIGTFL